jgi:L-aminopeptidase/D-esterase-like protein
MRHWLRLAALWMVLMTPLPASAQGIKPRARDLGVPFDGTPGPNNAITDVAGVTVGHTTLVNGKGKLNVGAGPVRTGVTAVLPRGRDSADPVYAGWFALNGNGEMTGTTWIEESGSLEGPVMLTNTSSVERMDPLFAATAQATEEAIINTLVAARTTVGRDDHTVMGLPHDRLREALRKYNRLVERP